MNEFIEKLIGRLENHMEYCKKCHEEFPNAKMSLTYEVQINAYKNAIEIVNQLAEEYKQCTLCYLQSPCEYQNENVEMPMEYWERGWIPCSERLPEDREEKLVYLSSGRTTIAKYNEHRLPFSDCPIGWGYDSSNGYIDFESETVIAWQPLPAPYKMQL